MHSFKDVGLLLESIYTYGGICVHLILSLFSTRFLFWLYCVTCDPTQAFGNENAESSPLDCQGISLHALYVSFLFFKIFIYLTASGFSCSTLDLQSLLWHAGFFFNCHMGTLS